MRKGVWETGVSMSKTKLYMRPNPIDKLWWKWMPGKSITVSWPVGEVRVRQEESGLWDYVRSADPNDFYRPWLEENVGKQGWDWDWRVGPVAAENHFGTKGYDSLIIKFKRSKAKWATAASLLWA
jgi:hypothetical protein